MPLLTSREPRHRQGKGKAEKGNRNGRSGSGGPASPPDPAPRASHSFRAVPRWRPRVRSRGVLRAVPRTHLFGNTTSRRPRPLRPPGAGGTRAGGRPPAEASGGAARGWAGGAGRTRPSAAGRSRAAAGSDTCRGPPPQPPRPLARGTSGAWPRPRRAKRADARGPSERMLPGS